VALVGFEGFSQIKRLEFSHRGSNPQLYGLQHIVLTNYAVTWSLININTKRKKTFMCRGIQKIVLEEERLLQQFAGFVERVNRGKLPAAFLQA
jgi:hypothetical protein